MTATYTIYHNPRCSKSRQTLALLEAHHITPQIVEYLNTPPDEDTVSEILSLLNLSPRELMRPKEEEYKEANLDNNSLSDAELISAITNTPKVMERPIVTKFEDGKMIAAVVGRPPENVNAII